MTTTLDALPLPEPALHVAFSDDGEHIRFWTRYAQSAAVWAAENWPTERVYSEAQYRAARREGYELALRKAQEGREPVAWGLVASNTGRIASVTLNRDECSEMKPEHVVPLYTSPPPKSDEARDALLAARDYVQQALVEHDRMYCRHPATESDRKLIVDDLAQVDAALAAQQKGAAS